MLETDELFSEVGAIRDEIEEQGAMINALVRANSKELKQALLDSFATDEALLEIYRRIDGIRTQKQIVDELKASKLKGASQAGVSRRIETLHGEGLIARVGRSKDGVVYKKSRLDAALGISRALKMK